MADVVGASVGRAAHLDAGLPQGVAGHLDIGSRRGALGHRQGDALGHAWCDEEQGADELAAEQRVDADGALGGHAALDVQREESLLAGAFHAEAHLAQRVDQWRHGSLAETLVAGQDMVAGGDGEQGHQEPRHRAGVVAVVDVGVALLQLRQQAAQQARVARGGDFIDAEVATRQVVNHQPAVAHALRRRQRDAYIVGLHDSLMLYSLSLR